MTPQHACSSAWNHAWSRAPCIMHQEFKSLLSDVFLGADVSNCLSTARGSHHRHHRPDHSANASMLQATICQDEQVSVVMARLHVFHTAVRRVSRSRLCRAALAIFPWLGCRTRRFCARCARCEDVDQCWVTRGHR